jgi:hypothetical protein
MTKQKFILIMIMGPFLLFTTLMAENNAKELLKKSTQAFDKGQYDEALVLLKTVDIRSDFDNSDDMKLGFKIRAIAYEQIGDIKQASETIHELYFLDPSYKFDPFDTPKSLIVLAEKQKKAIDEKTKHLASKKSEALYQTEESEPQIIEKTIVIEKKPSMVTTLFPLGLNHFHLKAPIKGGIYFSLQTLGLATNIAAFWWKQSYLESFGTNRLKDHNLLGRFETAQVIQYIGLGTLIISYCISVIDALIHFQNASSQKINSAQLSS